MDYEKSIVQKLKTYLLSEKGFIPVGEGVQKVLKDEKDFIVSDDAYILMHKGQIFDGQWRYLYDLISDNYKTEIEDKFEDWLDLTDDEIDWLHESEDEDSDTTGWDIISEWIWDYVDTACDRCAVDTVAGRVIKEYLESEKIA